MDFPIDEIGDGSYTKNRIDALKKVLREKEKENVLSVCPSSSSRFAP